MISPFRLLDDGSIDARLTHVEAQVLQQAAEDLIDTLDEQDESFRRLFPPAYDEEERQREYASMTREDLLEGKRQAARDLVASIEGGVVKRNRWTGLLDPETAEAWLKVLNDLRLVLGTRLDVSEEMDHTPLERSDPRAPAFNLYLYLGGIQELLVEAMLPA